MNITKKINNQMTDALSPTELFEQQIANHSDAIRDLKLKIKWHQEQKEVYAAMLDKAREETAPIGEEEIKEVKPRKKNTKTDKRAIVDFLENGPKDKKEIMDYFYPGTSGGERNALGNSLNAKLKYLVQIGALESYRQPGAMINTYKKIPVKDPNT